MTAAQTKAALLLADVRLRRNGAGPPIPDLTEDIRPPDLVSAYAIQRQVSGLLTDYGHGRPAGWKIGCTSPAMQAFVGVDHPCAGTMFDRHIADLRVSYEHGRYSRLGLECEIAVQLSRDLLPGDDPLPAIGAVMTSIEIVEERFEDYRTTAKESLVADDFFHVGCVLGKRHKVADLRDLAAIKGGFSISNAPIEDVGHGGAILGHPFNALTWLAEHLEDRGGVKEGEIVTLGSVIRTIFPKPGDVVRAEFEALGSVFVEIT